MSTVPYAPEPVTSGKWTLLGYGDESVRRTPESVVFILAAAIVRADRCEQVRAALRPLLLHRQPRLHWRDESAPRRQKISEVIAGMGVEFLVAVGAQVELRRQERARRQVLQRLLWELDQRRVEHCLLESRRPERDRHDLKAIGGFRNQGAVSRRLRVDHGLPSQEPLLWLPDAVAGAVGDADAAKPSG